MFINELLLGVGVILTTLLALSSLHGTGSKFLSASELSER